MTTFDQPTYMNQSIQSEGMTKVKKNTQTPQNLIL